MKTKTAIKAHLAAGILLAAVTGCANRGATSHNSDPGKDYSTGDFGISDKTVSSENSSSETSEPPEEEYVPKFHDVAINFEGIVVNNSHQLSDKGLVAMDNDNVYLFASGYPRTLLSLDRSDYSSFDEVMTYEADVEFSLNLNKSPYCGWYLAFPCYGNPYDGNGFTMRVYAGKTREETKCILDKEVSLITSCPAELNDTEMVFSCWGYGADSEVLEIYKYKVGDEQARLIHTENMSDHSINSSPKIACYNGEIYLIYTIDPSKIVIKTLNTNGKEIKKEIVELPNNFGDMSLLDLTVAENNILIRFRSNGFDGPYLPILINRKSKQVFCDFGDNTVGGAYDGNIIDGRYIILGKKSGNGLYNYPILTVFDDKTLEFYFLRFRVFSDVMNISAAVDGKGDIMFKISDDDNTQLVLYEDVTSLIRQ